MSITSLYQKYKAGKLTKERFAEKLGISPLQLTIRLGKHGDQIEKRFEILDKIAENLITRDQAALEWSGIKGGVNVRTINAAMRAWGVEREMTEDMVNRVAPKVKWEVIKKYSVDFIKGTLDLVKSAEAAGISDRQLRRWVSDLLIKHYDMPFKDLKHVTQTRREALAADILLAESLESGKIQPVLMGQISRFEEAELRIAAKRATKKGRRAEKAGNMTLADERKARRLISDLVKIKGMTYIEFKALSKTKRNALLKPLLKGAEPEVTRLLAAHLETLSDV